MNQVTRKRRKGPRPKQAIQVRTHKGEEEAHKGKGPQPRSESTKPEVTRCGETQGQEDIYPERRTPERRKETAKAPHGGTRKNGKGQVKTKTTNNSSTAERKEKTQKRWTRTTLTNREGGRKPHRNT